MPQGQPTEHEVSRLGRIGYRPFWVLKLSILLRAIHQIGAAVIIASFLLDEIVAPPPFYFTLAIISGIALLFAEWMRHREIYRELSGISTFAKLILLGLAYHEIFPQTPTMVVAFLLASIASHAPKLYRHRLLF